MSPLFLAAHNGSMLPCVQALLAAGASLEEGAGGRGTALHIAAISSAALCEVLVAAGATAAVLWVPAGCWAGVFARAGLMNPWEVI